MSGYALAFHAVGPPVRPYLRLIDCLGVPTSLPQPSFEWRPVHIYHRMAKKKELEGIKHECAALGITFSSLSTGPQNLPCALHTHYLVPKIQAEPSVPQLLASLHQLKFVTKEWVSALAAAALPPGDDQRSKLEEDFLSNWPDEQDFFPPVDGQDSNRTEKATWQPKPGRRKLFDKCAFIDCSDVSVWNRKRECSGPRYVVVDVGVRPTGSKRWRAGPSRTWRASGSNPR